MAQMTTDKQDRKNIPMARGLLDYFPDALAAVAHLSHVGNEQHNPGEELHWAKEKSTDHADCIMRHLTERGTIDDDGILHSTKVAWRGLALLQIELDNAKAKEKLKLDTFNRINKAIGSDTYRITATEVEIMANEGARQIERAFRGDRNEHVPQE